MLLPCILGLCNSVFKLFLASFFSTFSVKMEVLFCMLAQRAKKVVSDSPGLVDFVTGLVTFVLNLPDGQVLFFEEEGL